MSVHFLGPSGPSKRISIRLADIHNYIPQGKAGASIPLATITTNNIHHEGSLSRASVLFRSQMLLTSGRPLPAEAMTALQAQVREGRTALHFEEADGGVRERLDRLHLAGLPVICEE